MINKKDGKIVSKEYSKIINKQYAKDIDKIEQEYRKKCAVQLHNFIEEKEFERILRIILDLRFTRTVVPDKYSYQTAQIPTVIRSMFNELNPFLKKVTGKVIRHILIEMFQPGDYTLRKSDGKKENRREVILDFATIDEKCGGYSSIVNDDGEIFRLFPSANTLTILDIKKDQDYFVKYLNSRTHNPRLIIRLELY